MNNLYGQNASIKKEKQSIRNNPNRRPENSGLDVSTEGDTVSFLYFVVKPLF
jgi:hypothetical protein